MMKLCIPHSKTSRINNLTSSLTIRQTDCYRFGGILRKTDKIIEGSTPFFLEQLKLIDTMIVVWNWRVLVNHRVTKVLSAWLIPSLRAADE